MSKRGTPTGKKGNGENRPTPEARRKQVIVGVVMGVIVGVVISLFTQFWLWLPAGVALGLAVGAIMRPPEE